LFNVPFALVSLVDHDRQWLKASHGFELENAHRDVSFCSHAILNSHVMVVPDTLLDDRFADHPSVVERPRIRFYAGYPLRTADAYRVGTLCILDTKPREFDEFNVTLLRDLGQLVEQEFGS
jgi:GAF domain-containing protein